MENLSKRQKVGRSEWHRRRHGSRNRDRLRHKERLLHWKRVWYTHDANAILDTAKSPVVIIIVVVIVIIVPVAVAVFAIPSLHKVQVMDRFHGSTVRGLEDNSCQKCDTEKQDGFSGGHCITRSSRRFGMISYLETMDVGSNGVHNRLL